MAIFISKSREETLEIAKEFAKNLSVGDIILLNGDLGAGKTVFVKGVTDYFSNRVAITFPISFAL